MLKQWQEKRRVPLGSTKNDGRYEENASEFLDNFAMTHNLREGFGQGYQRIQTRMPVFGTTPFHLSSQMTGLLWAFLLGCSSEIDLLQAFFLL